MERALDITEKLVTALLAVALAAASVAMLAQVFYRYVLSTPLIWPEEFTVLLFAWITFLGSAFVQRTDSHLSIDTLRRVVSDRVGKVMDLVRLLVIAACSLVLIWQGISLTERTWILLYPAMEISRGLLYASVPVCFMIGLLFIAADIAARLRARN